MTTNQTANTLLRIISVVEKKPKPSKIELDILYNIYNLSINFFKIDKNLDNIQTIVTIARTFIDYYSVYHLLFLNGSEEEQDLRQKLYLCDGYNSCLKTYAAFEEIDSNNDLKNSKENSLSSIENIKKTFPKDFNKFCSQKHLDNFTWKFKLNTKNEYYSWRDLYELSFERKPMAKLFIEYFSLYVHGLSIQSIKVENDNFLNATYGTIDIILNSLNLRLLKKHVI